MVQPVDLDSRRYGGTYKLIGGALALDYANLVSYRDTAREHDWLDPPANLARWADAARAVAPVSSDLDRLLGFRELLARVFLAVADGTAPASVDVAAIGRRAVEAGTGRQLVFARGVAVWIDPAPSLLGQLAGSAAELLTSPQSVRRVRACDECRWVFLDATRNRSRRWCDPSDCGNRTRQRRHYQRRRRPSADD